MLLRFKNVNGKLVKTMAHRLLPTTTTTPATTRKRYNKFWHITLATNDGDALNLCVLTLINGRALDTDT